MHQRIEVFVNGKLMLQRAARTVGDIDGRVTAGEVVFCDPEVWRERSRCPHWRWDHGHRMWDYLG